VAFTSSALPSPEHLNQLDHLSMVGFCSDFTWGIVALKMGKMAIEGRYP
jgi:hypothetical protein